MPAKGPAPIRTAEKKNHYVIKKVVRTSKFYHLTEFTEKVGDLYNWTEGQLQHH